MKTKRYGSGDRFKRIYLVAPKHPENFWSMQGTVNLLGAKTLMPNAALATLMALATPAERGLFVKSLIETWKINPKLMRRAFTFLAQYHHFYDFVRRKLPGRI